MRYTFARCVLDTALRELRRDGALVPLEPKGYQVLLYLIEHCKRVVTRDELLAHAWPNVYVVDTTVARCLALIRKALGDSGSTQRVIKTLHGHGYRFVAAVVAADDSLVPGVVGVKPSSTKGASQADGEESSSPPSAERLSPQSRESPSSPSRERGSSPSRETSSPTVGELSSGTAGEMSSPIAGDMGSATAGNVGSATAGNVGSAAAGEVSSPTAGETSLPTAGETLSPAPGKSSSPPPAEAALPRSDLALRPEVVPAMPSGERRHVTVLSGLMTPAFALLSGVDVETQQELLEQLEAAVRRAVTPYDGSIVQLASARLSVVFGVPRAQEDHAERAVLGALALRREWSALSTSWEARLGRAITLGVGIHTGPVVVRAPKEVTTTASLAGDVLPLAEHLASHASVTILASAAAASLVGAVARVTVGSSVPVAGRNEPVVTYRIEGPVAPSPPGTAIGLRHHGPFIGRQGDLAMLRAHLDHVRAGHGRSVGIVGPPGMGKTRLVAEFLRGLDSRECATVYGRCQSHGQHTPYLPLIDLLQRWWGIEAADAVAEAVAKAKTALQASAMPNDGAGAQLLQLLGAPRDTTREEVSPQELRAQTFAAFHHLFLHESERLPLVILIEDLHWIDATSEEYLNALAGRLARQRLLLLATFRPGYRPPWQAQSISTQLALAPLRDEESRELVRATRRGAPLQAVLETQIVARSQGNPFFLEALTHAVTEEVAPKPLQAEAAATRTEPVPLQEVSTFSHAELAAASTEATPLQAESPDAQTRATSPQGGHESTRLEPTSSAALTLGDAALPSTGAGLTPTDAGRMAGDAGLIPTHAEHMPSDAGLIPADAEHMPSGSALIPDDAPLARAARASRASAQAGPISTQAPPASAQAALTHAPVSATCTRTGAVVALDVPDTIHSILAARIDHLPGLAKHLLQVAAVIGHDVPLRLLRGLAALPDDVVDDALQALQGTELLYEARMTPESIYSFQHSLVQDVAYQSLLRQTRHELHRRAVTLLEEQRTGNGQTAPQIVDVVERLAHHALQAESWEPAARYAQQAGMQAFARGSNAEAAAALEQAIAANERLPQDRSTVERAIDLRLALRSALLPSGDFARTLAVVREAERLAESLGDQQRLAQTAFFLALHLYLGGHHADAVRAGERAQALTSGTVHAIATYLIGIPLQAQGRYVQAIECFERSRAALGGSKRQRFFNLAILPSVTSCAFLAQCSAELGRFARAHDYGAEGLEIATGVGHPPSVAFASWGAGWAALRQGDSARALEFLERGLGICREMKLVLHFVMLAIPLADTYLLVGRTQAALPLLTQTLERVLAHEMANFYGVCRFTLAQALLDAGRIDEAADFATEALTVVRRHEERGYEAYALRVLGEIAHRRGETTAALDRIAESLTLAEALGMAPLQAHCHADIGAAYGEQGRSREARAALAQAIDRYRALEMRWHEERVEGVLARLG